ncbi:MAG: hypothetical protein KGR46_12040 [Verrucomicrobia bacterium]|nr:hypothetical protein [Verrucomicrobiota bacterium]
MKRTDNQGSLSRNKKKEKETQPTHKGSCTIEGVPYWIAAYVNENRETGEKYFKLYFEKKKTDSASPPAEPESTDLSSQPDIPF